MEEKQRILIVHNYYKLSGGEDRVVEDEKKLLEDHGHQVFLYTRSNLEIDEYSSLQKLNMIVNSVFSIRTYREVRKIIKEKKIDIVHVHNTLNLITPSVYYAAFSSHVPVVQTMHNFRLLCPAATFLRNGKICEQCVNHGLGCAVKHACYRDSRLQTLMSVIILKVHRLLGTYKKLYYICLTEFNRKKLLQGKLGIRKDRTFVKTNFVMDPETFFKTDSGADSNIESKTDPKIGFKTDSKVDLVGKEDYYIFIGRLEKIKGIDILLKAWKDLPQKLLICGTGPEENKVKAYIKKHHMEQVQLMGQVPHEEVLKLLAGAKALVFPTQWYEGQGIVVPESYAVGTPVIVSDLGNPKAMVEPGKTGLCFSHRDPEDLKRVIREFEKADGWETRDVFLKKYSSQINYQLLYKIYNTIYKQRSR